MAQTAVPTSLTSAGWTGAFADLGDASDATFIESPDNPTVADEFVCELGPLTNPGITTGRVIRVRADIEPDAADLYDLVLQLENIDDDSVITTQTYTPVPDAFADYALTVPEGDVALIHYAGGVRIRGWAVVNGGHAAVVFVWDAVVGATSYIVQIGTATGQSDVYNADVGNFLTTTRYLMTGIYFSRVVPQGAGSPTAEQEFTV